MCIRDRKEPEPEPEPEEESKFLSDWLGIKKVNKEQGVQVEEMELINPIYDSLDNHFKTNDVRDSFKKINLTSKTQEYIQEWLYKKERASKGVELVDFIVLVVFPALKKDNKDINNLDLLLYSLEMAVDFKNFIDDDKKNTQFNSYKIEQTLLNNKKTSTFDKIIKIKGVKDAVLKLNKFKYGKAII
jgi:hypothetical protein